MSDKLPELPSLKISRPVTEADIFERANPCWYDMALVKYWEARARCAVEALQEVQAIFDKEDYEVLDFLTIAERSLKAIGPLPEQRT